MSETATTTPPETAGNEKKKPARKRSDRKKPEPHLQVAAQASRCPKCDSTSRGNYFNVVTKPLSGIDPDGKPYTQVVWKSCVCEACQQIRRERFYENPTT